jgi:hypothetical protein
VRDAEIIDKFKVFFGCGTLIRNKDTVQFRIRNRTDIKEKLFPLLDVYPLFTKKALDALAFRQVHALIYEGAHLTSSGLKKIINIKNTINISRVPSLALLWFF